MLNVEEKGLRRKRWEKRGTSGKRPLWACRARRSDPPIRWCIRTLWAPCRLRPRTCDTSAYSRSRHSLAIITTCSDLSATIIDTLLKQEIASVYSQIFQSCHWDGKKFHKMEENLSSFFRFSPSLKSRITWFSLCSTRKISIGVIHPTSTIFIKFSYDWQALLSQQIHLFSYRMQNARKF